jgi:hypothetical protein
MIVLDMDCCTPLLWENMPARLSKFMVNELVYLIIYNSDKWKRYFESINHIHNFKS